MRTPPVTNSLSAAYGGAAARATALMASACIALMGCLGQNTDGAATDAVETMPASLTEARAELEAIDNTIATQGSSPALHDRTLLIRDRMEELSGLVDRVNITPNHSVSFIVTSDGSTLIGERMLQGASSVLAGNTPATMSLESIYRRLAPGRAIPTALLNARPAAAATLNGALAPETVLSEGGGLQRQRDVAVLKGISDEISVVRGELTTSAADDTYFRNNFCPTGNVFSHCVVDWTGGRFAQATSDHSITHVAFTGGTGSFFLTYKANGVLKSQIVILPGEVQTWWAVGGKKSVKNAGCDCCSACQTHYEASRIGMRWDVTNATGKVFDFGGSFYNKPLAWNSP